MRRAPDTGGLLVAAVASLFCLFLFVGPTHTQEFASLPDPYSECLASYDLGELANETVNDYHNYTESPRSRTILAILKSHFNSSSRQEIASVLNISVDCLDYLDFTLPEVALYLLNTTKFDNVTFDDVVRGVFVSKIQKVLQTMHQVKLYLIFFNMQRNETLYELAETHNVTLNESTVLEVLFLPLDSDINSLSGFLEIGLSAFDLLDRTPVDLARLLGLEDPYIIKSYTFLQLMQLSFAGRDYLQNLQEIWSSLGVAWQQINKENETTVLDVVLANVPTELHHLIPLATGIKEDELHLLNITLEEFAELVNMTAMDFSNYLVYPELIPFIINSMKDIGDIDEETEVEVTEAEKKIFLSYNVTIQDLIDLFNLTEVEILILPPVKIEILCVRFTLIRYAKNLNLSLADVAVKVNKTEAELSYNLTVEEFYVVIRKLLVVRTFEIMSQMLGVSQDFLVNSLNIHAPIPSLTMCELNTFLNITRHSVLGLNEVVTQRTLAFVVQINGISIKRVYKLTIQQFITQILQLDLHYFFTLNGLQYSYSPSRVNILLQYKFFQLEKFFHFTGSFKKYKFVIFRHSLVWIINRIIYLNETDVDECLLGQHRCHPLSQCVNVPGSYECHCGGLTGYRDRFCRDINECRQDFAVCPPNLYCKNTPGSYECVCARGFYHNATTNNCEDINECASDTDNLCSYGGLNCVNTQGSYYCACPNGTRYDSRYKICRDINECREDRGLCLDIDENAECKNRRPGYECKCKRGFEPYYNESVSPRVLLNCTDIDECSTGQEICPLYSECINTIGGAYCRCLPGFRFKRGRCRAKRFVHVLLIWLRAITFKRYTRIDCPSGFPYFGKLHKKLYIYPNGMISIGKKYRRSEPKRLKDLNKDVIAVFWANTDVKNAYITYQVVDRSTPEFREQLDNTTVMLKNCSGLDEFNATWMLVVTWESVSPYARFFFRNPYLGEQSTYQVVLITNGTSSYVIYSYEDGGMDWNRRLQRKCAVGYATKGKKYYYQEADSFSEDIFNIDTKEFVNDINGVRTRGYFCKSLNADDEPIVLTNEQKCMNWYNEEPDPDSWMEELSDCPASRKAVRRDNRYRKVSSRNRKGRKGSKIYCYELRFPTRRYRASQQCCYFKGGKNKDAFVSEAPFAGRAYRYHYRNQRLRQISDIEPFSACCSEGESELCTLFYQKRPLTQAASATEFQLPCWCRLIAGGCRGRSCRPRRRPRRRFRRPRRAWFFGDPHISTLDGFQYTFNGLGDYVLLRSKDNFLHFHGRTERPLNTDGELTNATVFSAFAFKTNDSDSGQIFFNDSVPGNLSITISGEMSCKTYTIENFNEGLDFNGMSLERSTINNNTIVVSFPSGFSIEVTPGIQLLQLSVSAPDDLMNNTQGLLGTFNGIDTDDLEYPNGTVIPNDSTEEEIFHLGQQWKVPNQERLFVSSSCMLQNVTFDGSFVPYFLNMSAVSEEIKALCKGNRECMFDVLTTGNEEIGKQTVGFEEDNQAAINELENTPPEITGPAEINVTLNQKTQFYIRASDPDNDTITLEIDDLPDGAMFNTSSGHFEWTPVNASNITLEFVATDSKNDSSVLPVIVNMCRCENGGECDFTEFVGDNTGVFRIVGCNCTDGFEGDFCEVEVMDACADEPCYDNVTCNSTKNPFGFQCGPCPAGLTGDGENCYEIDECEDDNGGCNQTCVNTFGSFYCECKQGYNSKDDGKICEEINECQDADAQHNCTENAICTNLPGSFKCTCKPGFEGDPTSNCTDIDECNNGDALCSQGCRNTPGSFECTCQDGFQLAANKETCEDINECTEKTHDCEQDDYCHNLVSSYECRCPPGLALNPDKKTCRVAEGSECDSSKGGCSDICVNRTGLITCYCNAGFSLNDDDKTCADINECLTGNPGCSHSCSNNDGSFKCTCPSGYALAVDGKTCDDVNECENPEHHNCSHVCENTEGSFVCSCEDGFVLQSDNTSCADVDECQQKDLCKDGVCINNPGSYQCACPAPRVYIRDKCRGLRKFAMDLKLGRLNGKSVVWDAALSNTKSAAFGILAKKVEKQTNSYFRSRKTKGFLGSRCRKFRQGSVVAEVDLNFAENATDVTADTLINELPNSGEMGNMTYDPQSAQVKDFDECASDETNNCHKYATCTNTAGSFTCKCKGGYQGDGITCADEPKPADSDDKDKKNRVAIIIGAVFGGLVLLIIIVVCWSKRQKRYKAEIEEPNHSFHLTSRSVHSDVRFRGDEKEKETRSGSYDVNPAPMYGNLESESRLSGDYEYPDPQPVGTKNTFYDNPGLQQETAQ